MNTGIDTITTELADIKNLATTLWFCGCKIRCGGCQNDPLIEFKKEGTIDIERVKNELKERRKLTEWLVYLGGNPLDSIDSVLVISDYAKELGYKQFIYTGYELDEIKEILTTDQYLKLLQNIDYIKVGKYDSTMCKACVKESSDYFFETINQRILKSNRENQSWEVFYNISSHKESINKNWFNNM